MTINERAVELCKEILYGDPDPRTVSSMAAAMTEAVAEEREAIAVTTDHWARVYGGVYGKMFNLLAEVIRDRATHPEPPPAAKAPDPTLCRHGIPIDDHCKPCEDEMIDRAERRAEGGDW